MYGDGGGSLLVALPAYYAIIHMAKPVTIMIAILSHRR